MSEYIDKLLNATLTDVKAMINDLVADALEDYRFSDKFAKDAETYCEEAGWRRPE